MNLNLSPDPQQNPFIKMLGQKSKIIAATSRLTNGGEIMLISDSKFLADDAGMSVDENMIFLLNVVDYLAGDEDLISLRSREVTSRPLDILQLDPSDEQRYSEGEKERMKDKKKKNEILQMSMLAPKLSILDETDSGLDIDALKIVADGVNTLRNKTNSFLIITHYQRLLDYIKPDFVHVLMNGKIIRSGGPELAIELEKKGYENFN